MSFFVFNVEYPKAIRFFYYFLESVVNVKALKSKVKGATLTEFMRSIKSLQEQSMSDSMSHP